jgi:hypothetical protein
MHLRALGMTRFSVLKDERNLIIGRDLSNVFEKGMVYEVVKILDEIIIRPVGKYVLPKKVNEELDVCEGNEISTVISSGLSLITKEEFSKLRKDKS